MGLTTWISMSQDIITGHIGAIHITHMCLTHMFLQKWRCRPQKSAFGQINI